jgi:hypothetical protein
MMSKKEEPTTTCAECGASIYKQHIESGIARYESGKLLCSHCVEEYEAAHDGASLEEELDPIALDEESDLSSTGTRIHGFTEATLGKRDARDDSQYKRPLNQTGTGATRCRLFHSKLSDGAVTFMADTINEWLDDHPDIFVKHITSTIGMFEGKVHQEPNLILTVFY